VKPWPYPRWVAHRGAGKLAPENTLAAFRLGADYGYRMFECDAKLSADGVPFLLHDSTLERTSNGHGTAGARPWSELAQLDAGAWHSRRYAGEGLPSLEALIRFCLANAYALNIEIKPTPGRERETGAAIALDCKSLWANAGDLPLLSSFAEAALAAARDVAPEVPRAYLTDRLPEDWRDRLTRLACIAIDVKHTLLTRGRVAEFRAAGLRICAWTVNDPARANELLAWGVDTVITDAVDVITPNPVSEV